MNLSFQKLFFTLATVFLFFAILILAKSVLVPLSFAMLFSFILFPLVKKVESWGMNLILAAFLSIFGVILIIGLSIFLFSTQIMKLSDEFSKFQDKILEVFADVTLFINNNLNFVPDLKKDELVNNTRSWLMESTGSLVQQTFSNTAAFFAGVVLTIIFSFLFLIYRKGLVKGFSGFYPEDKREQVVKMFMSVQQVGQKYLNGMVILILVIGFVNSIGLMIIGIDNPFLFGFLGAILAIIPYVGTAAGAIIPILYAFVTYDSLLMALAVAVLFWAVQLISDNFLSPKIVGGSMNVNALTAILSLIVGALIWGVAGMILFLPFAAMFRVVCEEYIELKPIALLIGNQNYNEEQNSNKYIVKWVAIIKGWFANFRKRSKKMKT